METLTIMVMSGVDDGTTMVLRSDTDGDFSEDAWLLTVGRKDTNDVCLRNDTFVSRFHGKLIRRSGGWWLEDKDSTNGSFVEDDDDFFADERVKGLIPIEPMQLFRLGRTWLRIQASD